MEAVGLLDNFRLMRAREMFSATSLNVAEVAFEVGFLDVAYFSRSFSAEFGLYPRDYQLVHL